MKISFSKYQGAGNDFILLDNRSGNYDALTIEQITFLCDRRFGIGADGLIKINTKNSFDFEADYYNADGSKSFCGNGGRCAVAYSESLGIFNSETSFLGFDGEHSAKVIDQLIHLKMNDVQSIAQHTQDFEIYTGSPHYIHFTTSLASFDIVKYGKSIRYNEDYKEKGINVNAVEVLAPNELFVRTYERGVEDETFACGTGVTACAIAYASKNKLQGDVKINIQVMGGNLSVHFTASNETYTNIWLIGPGTFVFKGEIQL